MCTQCRGPGSLSWLMIHRGALWLNLCNYTLSLSLFLKPRPITLCQPLLSHIHTWAAFFFPVRLSVVHPLPSRFSSLIHYLLLSLCLSLFPSFPLYLLLSSSLPPSTALSILLPPSSLCLLQINYALIYAQLSS